MSRWTTSRMLSSVWPHSLYILYNGERTPVYLGIHFGTFPTILPPFTTVKWRKVSTNELLHVEKLRQRLDRKMFENRLVHSSIRSKNKLCAKCKEAPRLLRQAWCKACFAAYYRTKKAAKQKKKQKKESLDIGELLDMLEKGYQ